jgi:hypothetical protein
MDMQIKDILQHYSYLQDDIAVEASSKSQPAFRCMFYDKNNPKLTEGMKSSESCLSEINANMAAGSGGNPLSTAVDSSICHARDINDLYYSYNYYCKVVPSSIKNALGRITNFCQLVEEKQAAEGLTGNAKDRAEMGNVFASQNSTAYYQEVQDRLEAGELKMVNFTDSQLYRSKIANLGLENLRNYDISSLLKKDTNCPAGPYVDPDDPSLGTRNFSGDEDGRYKYRYNGKFQACQKYDIVNEEFVYAELRQPKFTDKLATGKCELDNAESGVLQDRDAGGNCVACDDDFEFNKDVQMCQQTLKVGAHENEISQAEVYYLQADAEAQKPGAGPSALALRDRFKEDWEKLKNKYKEEDERIQALLDGGASKVDMEMFTKPTDYDDPALAPRDIFSDLGLQRSSSLFSINVVPPLSAGNLFPEDLFNKASEYCLDGSSKSLYGAERAEKEEYRDFNKLKAQLLACRESGHQSDMERYYLTGFWPKKGAARQDGGTYAETDYEETTFMSARKSCDVYEQTLVTVRDQAYASFDTQMKNYLEEELAKIIKKKVNDLTTIAGVASSLIMDDADRTIANLAMTTKRMEQAQEKKLKELEKKNELTKAKLEQEKKYFENRKKAMAEIAKTQENTILSTCAGLAGKKMEGEVATKNSTVLIAELGGITIWANRSRVAIAKPENAEQEEFMEIYCADFPKFTQNPAIEAAALNIAATQPSKLTRNTLWGNFAAAGVLDPGIYRVKVAGGGGGGGGGRHRENGGNKGENGRSVQKVFILLQSTGYELAAGGGGGGGYGPGCCMKDGHAGGAGGGSWFRTEAGLSLSAAGGGGGSGGGRHHGGNRYTVPNPSDGGAGGGNGGGPRCCCYWTGTCWCGCDGNGGSSGYVQLEMW